MKTVSGSLIFANGPTGYHLLEEVSGGPHPASTSSSPQYVVVSIPSGTRPGTTLKASCPDGRCFAFKVSVLILVAFCFCL